MLKDFLDLLIKSYDDKLEKKIKFFTKLIEKYREKYNYFANLKHFRSTASNKIHTKSKTV